MFETAKGSWPFTRACYAGSPELDVRDAPMGTVATRVHAALTAARSDGARYLVVLHVSARPRLRFARRCSTPCAATLLTPRAVASSMKASSRR